MVFLEIANMGQKSRDFWFAETHDSDLTAETFGKIISVTSISGGKN
jgi:hypothetical protein